ncbi:MAG: pantoate--beta-alanine ligase, partial [Flavobacteriaceae bacterium]
MQIIKTAEALLTALAQRKASVGLVPTMGALHQGHLSLIKRAISENTKVVVSIYINPTQFDRKEDLTKYPRTLASDLVLLESLYKDLIIYTPSDETLYPKGIVSKNYDFGSLATHMEGASRPGHFNGVATVVEALFNRVKPHKAYFGEKD